ncbi:DUF6398 domain-containing protein [Paeniglutamicibacter sulfureus]|uniref:DUF6398 domain-containing protein n=1 Tax=Paeniglutamicibacter sulfureus TaxID=43666 RepID=UPI002666F16E|nr:DUF6398 domain-containing protein [Paeniglutamicibacter sulfureus]MDO2934655.1 DUF6398 domain-containing protein [Paeniglutamicibacter sulfureus]
MGKLARKRSSSHLRGDLRIWASGILNALVSENFLFDPSQPMHMRAQQLGDLLGVKKTTIGNKGTTVHGESNLTFYRAEVNPKPSKLVRA